MGVILNAITSVGFPIVMCAAVAWFVKYLVDKQDTQINNLIEEHKAETQELAQALENNTVVMQKLVDALTTGGVTVNGN